MSESPSGIDYTANDDGTASTEEYDWRQDGEDYMSDDLTKRKLP